MAGSCWKKTDALESAPGFSASISPSSVTDRRKRIFWLQSYVRAAPAMEGAISTMRPPLRCTAYEPLPRLSNVGASGFTFTAALPLKMSYDANTLEPAGASPATGSAPAAADSVAARAGGMRSERALGGAANPAKRRQRQRGASACVRQPDATSRVDGAAVRARARRAERAKPRADAPFRLRCCAAGEGAVAARSTRMSAAGRIARTLSAAASRGARAEEERRRAEEESASVRFARRQLSN